MTWVLFLLAGAILMWPAWRLRGVAPEQAPDGGERTWTRRTRAVFRRRDEAPDPFGVAASCDLFALCLRAGLPVPAAAEVVAATAPEPLASSLRRAAELLALGADPERAWTAGDDPAFAELAALARRTARSGSSLADGVAELARATREAAANRGIERAERAGVGISGPLGLCFLPAFVCLGIGPVVIGLATSVLGG